MDWEDATRRRTIPDSLAAWLGDRSRLLVVPYSITEKIRSTHSTDLRRLDRLGEFLDSWEFVGLSDKGSVRLELYARLDGIWHTAVIALATDTQPYNVLLTFHRLYERKVRSRERSGRLKRRK